MSWDIYGNPLARGHCEVHPHVHEEYPCSVCMAEKRQREQASQQSEAEHYLQVEIDRLNAERDEQNIVLSVCKSAVTSMAEMIANHEYVGHSMPWSEENEDLDNLHCKIIDLHNDISRIGGERGQLVKALESFLDLVGDSHGVSGYHLNGDIAEWDEFECVGEAYELIKRIEGGAA